MCRFFSIHFPRHCKYMHTPFAKFMHLNPQSRYGRVNICTWNTSSEEDRFTCTAVLRWVCICWSGGRGQEVRFRVQVCPTCGQLGLRSVAVLRGIFGLFKTDSSVVATVGFIYSLHNDQHFQNFEASPNRLLGGERDRAKLVRARSTR